MIRFLDWRNSKSIFANYRWRLLIACDMMWLFIPMLRSRRGQRFWLDTNISGELILELTGYQNFDLFKKSFLSEKNIIDGDQSLTIHEDELKNGLRRRLRKSGKMEDKSKIIVYHFSSKSVMLVIGLKSCYIYEFVILAVFKVPVVHERHKRINQGFEDTNLVRIGSVRFHLKLDYLFKLQRKMANLF